MDELAGAWSNFSLQLHDHHRDEETIFWPILTPFVATPTLMGELEAEHARMVTALHAADSAMKAFDADPTAANTATPTPPSA